MKLTPIKTIKVTPGSIGIFGLLDRSIGQMHENSVLAVTSKIISLCENNVVPLGEIDKEDLIESEAELYLPSSISKHGYHFTIANHTLTSAAGVDVSNGSGHYVLWPKDPQRTANQIREYLAGRFKLRNIGVVITDSASQPFRRGAIGIALAHSGFKALRDYVDKSDLFGRPFRVAKSNVSGGLAAAAVLAMGEGSEQTPLCVISGLPFLQFSERHPTEAELKEINIELEDDLFEPFLGQVEWKKGHRKF